MTWKELKEKIAQLTDEQLSGDVLLNDWDCQTQLANFYIAKETIKDPEGNQEDIGSGMPYFDFRFDE